MKKVSAFITISVFMSVLAFSAEYSVKSVTGKVQYESSPNNWKALSVGQTLNEDSVISTGLNSMLVISTESGETTIRAMQQGSIQELTSSGKKIGGLTKSKNVNRSLLASNAKANASTVSRASESKKDLAWDE